MSFSLKTLHWFSPHQRRLSLSLLTNACTRKHTHTHSLSAPHTLSLAHLFAGWLAFTQRELRSGNSCWIHGPSSFSSSLPPPCRWSLSNWLLWAGLVRVLTLLHTRLSAAAHSGYICIWSPACLKVGLPVKKRPEHVWAVKRGRKVTVVTKTETVCIRWCSRLHEIGQKYKMCWLVIAEKKIKFNTGSMSEKERGDRKETGGTGCSFHLMRSGNILAVMYFSSRGADSRYNKMIIW